MGEVLCGLCYLRFVRMPRALLVSLVAVCLGLTAVPAFALKVACTGSSSMAGVGSSEGHHISDELAAALGAEFAVMNFGVAATTAIKAVDNAYYSTPQMTDALAFNPDVVLFWFGGNDSWADVWPEHGDEFKADYLSLVQEFQALPSHPKTFLIRLWVFQDGPAQLDVLDQEILPIIDQIGAETNSTVIDYRTFIEPHPEWFDDGMHADDTGTVFIGQFFADEVTAALIVSPDAGVPNTGGTAGTGGSTSPTPGGTGGAAGGSGGTLNTAGTLGNAGTVSSAGTVGTAGTVSAGGALGAAGQTATPTSGTSGTNPSTTSDAKGCACSHIGTPNNGFTAILLSALAMFAACARRRVNPH